MSKLKEMLNQLALEPEVKEELDLFVLLKQQPVSLKLKQMLAQLEEEERNDSKKT